MQVTKFVINFKFSNWRTRKMFLQCNILARFLRWFCQHQFHWEHHAGGSCNLNRWRSFHLNNYLPEPWTLCIQHTTNPYHWNINHFSSFDLFWKRIIGLTADKETRGGRRMLAWEDAAPAPKMSLALRSMLGMELGIQETNQQQRPSLPLFGFSIFTLKDEFCGPSCL